MTSNAVTANRGELSYLAPQSKVLRRFTAPGASINTGEYESHVVPVRDGRSVQHEWDVDVHGFALVRHTSAVTDFTDKAEVDAVYVPEVLDFVKVQLGADEVVSRGWVLRRSAAPRENSSQPQAGLVHIDYAPEGAAQVAADVYAEEQFQDGAGITRAVTGLAGVVEALRAARRDWRWPDYRGVGAPERLPNWLYFVDHPEDPFGSVEGLRKVTSGSEFHYNPAHEWWYFPEMTRDEVLFFKFHDSDHGQGLACAPLGLSGSDGVGHRAPAQHRVPHVRLLPLDRPGSVHRPR